MIPQDIIPGTYVSELVHRISKAAKINTSISGRRLDFIVSLENLGTAPTSPLSFMHHNRRLRDSVGWATVADLKKNAISWYTHLMQPPTDSIHLYSPEYFNISSAFLDGL